MQGEAASVRKLINRFRFFQAVVFILATAITFVLLFVLDPLAFVICIAFLWGGFLVSAFYLSLKIKNVSALMSRTAPYQEMVFHPHTPVYQVMTVTPQYLNSEGPSPVFYGKQTQVV